MKRLFFILLIAFLSSLVFYCGTAFGPYAVNTINDAGAEDASIHDACTPAPDSGIPQRTCPNCKTCSEKVVYYGYIVEAFEETWHGPIADFDPDSDRGMPTIRTWYYDAVNNLWTQAFFPVLIDDLGYVLARSNSVEYVNREYQIVLHWIFPCPE